MIRNVLIAILLLFIAAAVWYGIALKEKNLTQVAMGVPFVKPVDIDDTEMMSAYNIRLTAKKDNVDLLELTAEQASFENGVPGADLSNFFIVTRTGETAFHITADSGVVNTDSYYVSAKGNAVIRDELGNALITEGFVLSTDDKTLSIRGPIRIFGDRFAIYGVGLIAQLDGDRTIIKSNVRAVFEAGE